MIDNICHHHLNVMVAPVNVTPAHRQASCASASRLVEMVLVQSVSSPDFQFMI